MATAVTPEQPIDTGAPGPKMLDQLLAAGVHFGHQTRRWNPKMRRFIFAERNGIHIIDLNKTLRQLDLARQLVRETVLRGEQVLFVCTKRQLAPIVQAEAERCGAYSITERWLGGLLTNYSTVKKQIKKLKDLEAGSEEGGDFSNYTKKEQLMMSRERDKLAKNLSGIKNMGRLPGLMFVVDSKKEHIAVEEARKLGIPVVAIVDTNADPDLITVPIAGNDDAIRSVELITHTIADTIAEARREAPQRSQEDEAQESYTYSSDRGSERADRGERGDRGPRGSGGPGGGGPSGGSGGGEGGGDRARRPRRRRARPDAIAAVRRTGPGGESSDAGDGGSGSTEAAGSEAPVRDTTTTGEG